MCGKNDGSLLAKKLSLQSKSIILCFNGTGFAFGRVRAFGRAGLSMIQKNKWRSYEEKGCFCDIVGDFCGLGVCARRVRKVDFAICEREYVGADGCLLFWRK